MNEPQKLDDRVRWTDEDILARFEQQAISRAEWTHRAHVMVAYLYLRDHPFEDAMERIRKGIKALNAANGVIEGPGMGYSETLTVAFARLILAVAQNYHPPKSLSGEEFCDKHPELLCSKVFRLFYSPMVLANPMSKSQFLEPDLAQLPRVT